MPTHQARKESIVGNQRECIDWPKPVGGGNLASAYGGNTIFKGNKHGKQTKFIMNELERHELKEHAGEATVGEPTKCAADSKGAESGGIMVKLADYEGAEFEWAKYGEIMGEPAGYVGATKWANPGAIGLVDMQGTKLGGNQRAVEFGYPSACCPNLGKNDNTEHEKCHDGKRGLQLGQLRN
ncbi:hypothetical protein FH972_015120 [Carpinus fangiana]|uniref:Uncharacterized protein n=1 Tax=Carpinus fangiana TaxID=176857 RepID=A0A5N6RBU0_9ROSI|nr:hypothetical protein FH972_015120 [Carpinus fangiana]